MKIIKMATDTTNASMLVPPSFANTLPKFDPKKDNWSHWYERLEIHMEECDVTEEKMKRAVLLKAIGLETYSIVRSLCHPKKPNVVKYDDLITHLKRQYAPPVIVFRERKTFGESAKNENESVVEWHARVRKLACTCEFGTDFDKFVLNQFVCGLSGSIFDRLCEEDETLTMTNALKKAMAFETRERARISSEVNYLHSRQSHQRTNGTNSGQSKKRCSHCGWHTHRSEACKFKDSKCHACGSIGHLKSVCFKSKKIKNRFC